MRRALQVLVAALILALPVSYVLGARDLEPAASGAGALELVVFEVDGCVYCEVLRRDVAPLYRSSERGKQAPIRFVNVSHSDESKLALADAITIAPTVVLLRDGREVDRITGYTGPQSFIQLVSVMIGRTD